MGLDGSVRRECSIYQTLLIELVGLDGLFYCGE